MKKIILMLIFISNLFGWSCVPCSFIANSGSESAYNDLDDFLDDKNKDLKDYWDDEIKNVIDEIKDESQKKEKHLNILKELEKARLLVNKEMEFLLKQEAHLLGNEANIEAEIKE